MSQLPLEMTSGDDAQFLISVTKAKAAGGGAYDLTGCQVAFTIRERAGGAVISSCTTANNAAEITSPGGGLVIATVPAADTAALSETTNAVYDVQVTTEAGKKHTPRRGRITIHADVTD